MSVANWARLNVANWWLGGGSGFFDAYSGNADAAQLWIDVHSGSPLQNSYQPYARFRQLRTEWYGVGRSFAVPLRNAEARLDLAVRSIEARKYVEGVVTGSVAGEDFSGLVKRVSSETLDGSVVGRGWCVDAGAVLNFGAWRARATAEGLIGRVQWSGLVVDDAYITSPGVFTDAEGFLRDVGGDISGLSWRTDWSVSINPLLRFAFVRDANPSLLLSATFRKGERGLVGAGLAWRRKRGWIPYFRVYPNQSTCEVGVVARDWSLRVSGDDWLWRSPKRARAELSVNLR